jgi:hypothetical protein
MMADKQQEHVEPEQPVEPAAWDRVGQFFQDMTELGTQIAKRNLDVWNQASSRMRGDQYTADAMTTDAAAAFNAALDNLEDVWTFLMRPPERQRVAAPLPTAFVSFSPRNGKLNVSDPVWIRVPLAERKEPLPDHADVYLEGDEERVRAIRECISVERKSDRAYLLEGAASKELPKGLYVGLISIASPPRPLANLRIVVQG